MRDKCVNCHNTYPQTPIDGWQVGDVRGILEVTMPMASGFAQVNEIFTQLVAMISALLIGSMLGGSYLLRVRSHKKLVNAKHQELNKHYQSAIKMAELGAMVARITHEISLALDHHYQITKSTAKLLTEKTLLHRQLSQYFDDATQALELSVANNERVLALISSFKNVAVNQCSQKVFEIDVTNYLQDIVMMLHPTLKRLTHTVVVDAQAGIVVNCLAGSLAQVVTNIINNAILHAFDGEENGTITITVRDGDMVEIEIRDDGLGMGEALEKRVFDECFTTKQGQGGSGLGLAICQQLVSQDLGGELTLSSELGSGTVVIFTISKD